jgi:hypothetical protein
MSLPEEHKTAIISNGLHFMRSITEAYGAEKGLELWEQITSSLDPEVKGQIFFAMITGTYNDKVELRGVTMSGQNNAVACIKAIRQYSGLGLKESKDIYDRLRDGHRDPFGSPRREYLKVKHEDYSAAVAGLRNAGFTV